MQNETSLRIVDYSKPHKPYFESLNKAWITKYLELEPMDEEILGDPKGLVIDKGGFVLFAKLGEVAIGSVALKYVNSLAFELTKLAVDNAYQGFGTGKALCIAAIQKAKDAGAELVGLSTESRLKAAIGIYRKLGFVEVPIVDNEYKRVDMMMELRVL